MNSCSGTPRENTFRYKLPKYVTKTSLTKATTHLKHSYELFEKDSGLNPTDYLSNLLSDILPYVHADICRHFACITEFETHETVDHDDSRHVVNREFSIAVNVPLVNVVERMSARNVGSTAHYVFVHWSTYNQKLPCLPATWGLLRMRRVLNVRSHVHCPNLERKIDRTLFTDRWRRWRWLWMRGRNVSLFCSLISTISGSASFTP